MCGCDPTTLHHTETAAAVTLGITDHIHYIHTYKIITNYSTLHSYSTYTTIILQNKIINIYKSHTQKIYIHTDVKNTSYNQKRKRRKAERNGLV